MKKFTVIILLLSIASYGQNIITNIEDYGDLDKGTTYFVKSDDEIVNKEIEGILSKFWTINKYDIITAAQMAEMEGENVYFLKYITYSYDRTSGTTGALNVSYKVKQLAFLKLLDKAKREHSSSALLASAEVNNFSRPELIFSVRMLDNRIRLVQELNSPKTYGFKDLLEKASKENSKILKDKTLYLYDSYVKNNIDTVEELEKTYPYKFKFVTVDEMENAIINEQDIVYVRYVRLRTKQYAVFVNAKTSDIIYGTTLSSINGIYLTSRFFKKMIGSI